MILASLLALAAKPAVELRQTTRGYELLRNGRPYTIKGVGGSGSLDLLAACGGNSVRTWGAEQAPATLDAAQKRGLTVALGVWLGHRSSFDYNDPAQVKRQFDAVQATILKHRSHPALLVWGLGNEMEEGGNDTPALWRAVDDLHAMAREEDPNHPAMTVVADVSQEKIDRIKRYAPHLQVLGINSYGGATSLPQRLKAYGWTKPYVLTEFGPTGPWEARKTPWGAAPEPDSGAKALWYRKSYLSAVAGNRGQCLGAYAFLWGDKQEETPTWFGMLLPTGERTQAVDEMSRFWTGKPRPNQAPRIRSFAFDLAGREVKASSEGVAKVEAADPDRDPLAYAWEVRRESSRKGYAGEGEERPGVVESPVAAMHGASVRFALPARPGPYRLYLTIRDGKGNAATANAPFAVLP